MSWRGRLHVALVALLVGCASTTPAPPVATPALVWPSPPEPARVRLLMTIARPEDVEAPRGLLRRVWDVIAGREIVTVQRPYGMAVDGEGRLYVVDTVGRLVHVFDLDRRRYRAITQLGARRFAMPIGVAAAPDGRVYVSDAELRTIAAFDAAGHLVREFGADLERPTGLALSPDGQRLYAVDTTGHRVAVFDAGGTRVKTIGRRGGGDDEFNYPTNVTVDRAGLVYVTDTLNFKVKVFSADGALLGSFGQNGDGTGDLARPKGLAVDSDGHIYLIEGLHDVVQVFERSGRFLLAFGGTGHAPGQFWLPTGLHIDRRDRIYVADSYNNRVQVFEYLRGQP
jgi:DNA-binding beta-propeller fold protein YncE